MPTISMSGADTVIINNHPIVDFATGDVAVLKFPNAIAAVKTGKNGNSIYSLNESGKNAELELTVLRGSPDDNFLNGLLSQQQVVVQGQSQFASFPLISGQLVKLIGDGAGKLTSDTYVLGGGVFTKQVEAKSNVEGDLEQSTAKYTLMFSSAPRTFI